ncbi:ArsR/SmtB family transcription factor [Paenibacillus gansuensis]|uniref:ArsR/SmtB family transcription factor n=1 Tax=Paenibacillus gansuensis TaxID=306542 RepID=A0ABW5P8Y8_9BACL
MLYASTDRKWLPLYEALASSVRLQILELLGNGSSNVKDLAEQLGLSPAIVTMHVRKLEVAGLISTARIRKDGGTHKICSLSETAIEIALPSAMLRQPQNVYEQSIPVGHYTSFEVHPTCGLSTSERWIGEFDDPRHFLNPERMNAGVLWFGKGYVEYQTPNYLRNGQKVEQIVIEAELASEAPGVNENWPSDISFYLNGVPLGFWTSPGDFGLSRGRYTPDWWSDSVNQHGLWKVIRITREGTFADEEHISDTTVDDVVTNQHYWTLRFAVEEGARHAGGMTLYGAGFGNYNEDMKFKVFYRNDHGI